jgi:transposase
VIGSEPLMGNPSPPLGIREEDGNATPIAVRVVVMELLPRVTQREARLTQPSRNSSTPPSSAPPQGQPRAGKEPTGRKSGGQPGQEGQGRKLKPESEVEQLLEVRPAHCERCGTLWLGEEAEPERHQVTEVPGIAPLGTEYRRPCLGGVAGGARAQAPGPAALPAGSVGPRRQATVGYLPGRLGARQRGGPELFAPL